MGLSKMGIVSEANPFSDYCRVMIPTVCGQILDQGMPPNTVLDPSVWMISHPELAIRSNNTEVPTDFLYEYVDEIVDGRRHVTPRHPLRVDAYGLLVVGGVRHPKWKIMHELASMHHGIGPAAMGLLDNAEVDDHREICRRWLWLMSHGGPPTLKDVYRFHNNRP